MAQELNVHRGSGCWRLGSPAIPRALIPAGAWSLDQIRRKRSPHFSIEMDPRITSCCGSTIPHAGSRGLPAMTAERQNSREAWAGSRAAWRASRGTLEALFPLRP